VVTFPSSGQRRVRSTFWFCFAHSKRDLRPTGDGIETLNRWSPRKHHRLDSLTKPLLLVTADRDERVEPDPQVYEMALALQARCGMNAPIYLHVEPGVGHDAPVDGAELTFIAEHLDIRALNPLFE
jgi:pimeloyl-ACP methyl ester carboxylesterase